MFIVHFVASTWAMDALSAALSFILMFKLPLEALPLPLLLAALVTSTASAASLDSATLDEVDRRLARLSDAIAHRYFLQGHEALRAAGLTLA